MTALRSLLTQLRTRRVDRVEQMKRAALVAVLEQGRGRRG